MRVIACFFATALLVPAQPTAPNPGFRLGYVRSIYIESLGTDDAARIVRDQIAGAVLNRTHIVLTNDKAQADATLAGTAMVTSGNMHWMVGSGAANQTSATAQVIVGGGTVRITELGLQMVDPGGRILWAYDRSKCLNTTTLILWGVPTHKGATVCAAEQLAKAIDKDARRSRR
jgi:hypothetical protein